ncbi:MAG: hydrolase [Bacteroidota bacterium]
MGINLHYRRTSPDQATFSPEGRPLHEKQGFALKKLYFGYTTCPACAKAYGKNYVLRPNAFYS